MAISPRSPAPVPLVPPFLVASLAVASCATPAWTPAGGLEGEQAIYETAARFIVQHYDPGPTLRDRAFTVCLALGRRSGQAVGMQERSGEWDPDKGMLGRLGGLVHPVAPISECAWNDRLEEVHLPTARPAVVVGISHPAWEDQTTAHVDVRSRETEGYAFRYRCRLDWRIDQWMVDWCL